MRSHRQASVAIVSKAAAPLAILFLMGASACSAQSGAPGEEEVSSTSADLDVSRFHGWNEIPTRGPGFFSPPAVTVFGTTTNVYGIGLDDLNKPRLWLTQATTIGGTWSGWTQLTNGSFTTGPAAALWNKSGESALSESVVIATGTDNNLYMDWTIGGIFGNAASLIPATDPTGKAITWPSIGNFGAGVTFAVTGSTPTLYVVAIDSNSNLIISKVNVSNGISVSTGVWTFNVIAGPLNVNNLNTIPQYLPALTTWGSDLVLVAYGTDSQYYYNQSADGVHWNAWTALTPGVFLSSPTVASHGPNVEVTGVGYDYHMWVTSLTPSTGFSTGFVQTDTIGVFEPVQGVGPGSAGAPISTAGVFELVGHGTDGNYYANIWQ
jgi:hypothetical protein